METSYENQKAQIDAGQSADCRVKLSLSVNEMIEAYQAAYRANTGRKISKADAVCKLIAYGTSGLKTETERHERLAAERAASM